jgi:hypothetical protein
MQVDSVDQFQVELFKQVLEMMKQLNNQIIQQTQNVNQAKKPPENQNSSISIYA